MTGFEKPKKSYGIYLLWKKCLILDDNFLELYLQRKMSSQRKLKDIMRNKSPSLDYCMKPLHRGQDAFTQFIDIFIETKQNDIVILVLANT